MMDESEIPIDIHTGKLMEWLISRRHIPHDWSKRVLTIREKINEAIKDMPERKEITNLLSGSYINYYHCKKIIEILKETEVNSKNLFGQYTSKRMKDWVEIVKLYEKDNIYLGEVASLLQRNVNYEVPALKKQIAKSVTMKNEYDKKAVNYEKTAETLIKDFHTSCKSLGIDGVKIKKELLEKAKGFSKMCEQVSNEIKTIKSAADFYVSVVQELLDAKKQPLESLRYIIDNGNTTVYQWRFKKVPTIIEENPLIVGDDEEVDKSDTIDFGIETETNFDDNIDWGISTVETEEIENNNISTIFEKGTLDENIAKGEYAQTILSHAETRNSILNDVLELEVFLKVRLNEMTSETDGLSLTMLPESLQSYDQKAISDMLSSVQSIRETLTNPTSLHYLNIMTNQKYLDQLSDRLKQKLISHEKMLTARDCVKIQAAEVHKEGDALKPKVDLLIKRSQELQEQIEQDISKRYKGRPVNLMGGAYLL